MTRAWIKNDISAAVSKALSWPIDYPCVLTYLEANLDAIDGEEKIPYRNSAPLYDNGAYSAARLRCKLHLEQKGVGQKQQQCPCSPSLSQSRAPARFRLSPRNERRPRIRILLRRVRGGRGSALLFFGHGVSPRAYEQGFHSNRAEFG